MNQGDLKMSSPKKSLIGVEWICIVLCGIFELKNERASMTMRLFRNKLAQTTVEYILLTTAVVVIVIAIVVKNGAFSQAINQVLFVTPHMITNASETIHFH